MSYGDDYMKFMIQKYRLAVSLAVLKIKPKNITMEEHIKNLRSKLNVSTNSNDNVMVCEEDFNLSDDYGNASNNSEDILQSFDFNKMGEFEKSTDEMVVSNSNNEVIDQKKISNINTSQSTFCETPNSQTYLMCSNENNNDLTFYESLSQNVEANLEIDITENLNKTKNPILNPQNVNVYGVTDKYTHISQSQDNCIISSRCLLSKSDANKFNEEIFGSTDSIPLSCIKEKLNENSLLNRITTNIEKNTDSGDSLKKQKSNKIYEEVFSSDDNIPLCYTKEKNNKNFKLKINYNKPEEVVDNDNSEKNRNGNKIQEKTFCSNDNISLKHVSENMNNSPLANKIINNVDEIVLNDNSVTSANRNILPDVTFSIEDNVSMSYRKENINENSPSDGVTNYVETVVNDNIQLNCLKGNVNNNIHLSCITEHKNKSNLANKVTSNIETVVNKNSERKQKRSIPQETFNNGNTSVSYMNKDVNKDYLQNKIISNIVATEVNDNSDRKQRKLQKLSNYNVTNTEIKNIHDDNKFNADLFSNSNISIENKTPQNIVNYNDLSSFNNNTASNSSQFTFDMSLTDPFDSYNEGINRNLVRSKDLRPFSQNSFLLDEHEYISQPSQDFTFITLSNKSNADTNFTLTNKNINERFKNSQQILDINMAEPNINLNIKIDNFSNNTTECKRKVFIKEKFSDITESQVEIVTFKVLEELNKVKNYLNKRESSDGSDSKYKGSFLSGSQSSISINQSAHCLLHHITSSGLVTHTQHITSQISIILGKLIDKLHGEEQYPNFMEKAIEAVDDLLNYIYTGDNCEVLILLKKEQAINRFFLLNKSSHIIQYSIQKITKILQETLENIKLDDFELKHTNKAENVCYIFNILEVLLIRHAEIRKSLSQNGSQTSKDDRILKKSVLTEMWREKWNLCKKEVCEGSSQNNNFLSECSEILNKITVEAMDGYSLVSFAALQCYNLLHN